MRILYLDNPKHADYGCTMLYDGLVRCLGVNNVVDYPYKDMNHGINSWPWMTERKGIRIDNFQDLNKNDFDCIIMSHRIKELQLPLERLGTLPRFIVDFEDSIDIDKEFYDAIRPLAIFKREYEFNKEYPENAYPCPFSCPLYDIEPIEKQFETYLSCAPNGEHRAELVGELVKLMNRIRITWNDHLHYDTYLDKLRQAKIGISISGGGYDTVRFWEILACPDTLLFADKPTIRMPHPFEPSRHYIEYDINNINRQVIELLDDDDRRKTIATEGHKHMQAFHTTKARAEYVLNIIDDLINRKVHLSDNKELTTFTFEHDLEQWNKAEHKGKRWHKMIDGGAVEIEVGQLLYSLVRMNKPDVVIETGTGGGGSLIWLAQAVKDNGFGTIHTFEMSYHERVEQWLKQCNLFDVVKFHTGNIKDTLPVFLQNVSEIGFALLDSDHTQTHVEFEIDKICNKMRTGDMICIHDTHEIGVTTAIEYMLSNYHIDSINFDTQQGFYVGVMK